MVKKKKQLLTDLDLLEEALPRTPVIQGLEYRALIEWRDGTPHLVSTPVRLSESPEEALRELLRKCLDLPYNGFDPAFKGLTNGEAMAIKLSQTAADGNLAAVNMILDRLLGRPKQSIESVNLSGDLNSFLDRVAEETKTHTIEVVTNPPSPTSVEDL